MNKQKLELTWIGKGDSPKLEPRVLIEDPEKSYGDRNTENMLIHGDNLLALKALESAYSETIQCIYIDPPYNTGSRIKSDGTAVGYDDGLEHSEWLNMMRPRMEYLKKLIKKDGFLIVQIDDREFARLYLLMVEMFGEETLKTIVVKMSEATGKKMASVKKTNIIPKLKEYLIIHREGGVKDFLLERIPKEKWDNEYKTLLIGITKEDVNRLKEFRDNDERDISQSKNISDILNKIQFESLSEYFRKNDIKAQDQEVFKFSNAWRIVQIVSFSGSAKKCADQIATTMKAPAFFVITPRKELYYIKNGYELKNESPRCKIIFADDYLTVHPGDFWGDIKTTGLDNEGGVDFKNGKKPELLLKRLIAATTRTGDLVLDSFAGSGTTPGVAHKMGRKWIAIEMAHHCYTHTLVRLKNVISGADIGKVGEEANWKGGGGFKFYTLAPSLLKQDSFGNWVIEEKYNPDLLAAAVGKHEGFNYSPDSVFYWKQGKSTERDYIYTTTQFLTLPMLDKIHEEMKKDESLLICCKSFQKACKDKYHNITIKKIPQMLLGRCEFGKEDYSLNIINLPEDTSATDGSDEE